MSRLVNFRKLAVNLSMLAILVMSFAVVARADSTQLTLSNINIVGFTGPYATVDITRNSLTTATITFTGLSNGSFTYLIGGAQAADLNFNGGPVSFSNVSFTGGCSVMGCPAGGTGFSGPSSGNADGWGTFNFRLDNTDGFTNAVSSLTFDVSCPSCNWTTVGDVLAGNAQGRLAAAHIFVAGSDCDGSPCTGFATTGSSPVPEPASLFLLGAGLAGMAGGLRSRYRKVRPRSN